MPVVTMIMTLLTMECSFFLFFPLPFEFHPSSLAHARCTWCASTPLVRGVSPSGALMAIYTAYPPPGLQTRIHIELLELLAWPGFVGRAGWAATERASANLAVVWPAMKRRPALLARSVAIHRSIHRYRPPAGHGPSTARSNGNRSQARVGQGSTDNKSAGTIEYMVLFLGRAGQSTCVLALRRSVGRIKTVWHGSQKSRANDRRAAQEREGGTARFPPYFGCLRRCIPAMPVARTNYQSCRQDVLYM